MGQTWTFGQKLFAGFFVVIALSALSSGIAYYAIKTVAASKDQVIDVHDPDAENAEWLFLAAERELSDGRAALLDGAQNKSSKPGAVNRDAAEEKLKGLTESAEKTKDPAEMTTVRNLKKALDEYFSSADQLLAKHSSDASAMAANIALEKDVTETRKKLDEAVTAYVAYQHKQMEDTTTASNKEVGNWELIVILVAIAALVAAIIIGLVLTRSLTAQIGGAVQHITSSSTELQAAANQQATGAKEQATSMNEISTTISELLATSRQIAESAQRVAQIAQETSAAARGGDQTVQRSLDTSAAIRRQVDQIVTHMLDLGKKSQQIGGILEIINELAEQTNILSINATIEAAGAGESGKRFSVVADEIRKLADRVGSSSKEIRGLIDEIRAAVNTTVMATESGSKTVDAGARQFNEVAAGLKQIAGLVGTTTEAAREIELSTKQQTTAVEQVNVAISNVAQATKESETCARQTLQTASTLTTLSADLNKLVRKAS